MEGAHKRQRQLSDKSQDRGRQGRSEGETATSAVGRCCRGPARPEHPGGDQGAQGETGHQGVQEGRRGCAEGRCGSRSGVA
eukprot:4749896-Prymnesium_polylepis.1